MVPIAAAFPCWFRSCRSAERLRSRSERDRVSELLKHDLRAGAFWRLSCARERKSPCANAAPEVRIRLQRGDGACPEISTSGIRRRGTTMRSPGTSGVRSGPLLIWVTDHSGTWYAAAIDCKLSPGRANTGMPLSQSSIGVSGGTT